jgi:hypothetical protein
VFILGTSHVALSKRYAWRKAMKNVVSPDGRAVMRSPRPGVRQYRADKGKQVFGYGASAATAI